jgi:hypothetical protein
MKKIFSKAFLLMFIIQSCANLDVEYKNLPDYEKAMSNPEDVYNIAKSGFYNWYMANTSSLSPRMSMWVAADNGTCSWANSGMLDLSTEPRATFNNDVTYTYANVFESYYQDIYSNLSQANDVLKVIDNGMVFGDKGKDTPMIQANCYFIQGISLGYLGLVYDQAFVMTAKTDIEKLAVTRYNVVMDSAYSALNNAIKIAESNSFVIDADWFGGESYSNIELARLAHSFIARFKIQAARNASENEKTDWQAILENAQKGIKKPLMPYIDNVKWKHWFYHYTIRPDWAKIDLRVIHLMDTDYPSRFPDNGISPGLAQSPDARLQSDFHYVSIINMKPERGYYHFSNYEYSRIELEYVPGVTTGYATDFSIAETELMQAEAFAHLGDLPAAIAILNKGTRITRGELAPLSASASKAEVLDAIFYERDIELIMTGFGIAFFDMRRRDMLQKGTLLHFPIPAKELMLLNMPVYTFGGEENADGINTSNGGWF